MASDIGASALPTFARMFFGRRAMGTWTAVPLWPVVQPLRHREYSIQEIGHVVCPAWRRPVSSIRHAVSCFGGTLPVIVTIVILMLVCMPDNPILTVNRNGKLLAAPRTEPLSLDEMKKLLDRILLDDIPPARDSDTDGAATHVGRPDDDTGAEADRLRPSDTPGSPRPVDKWLIDTPAENDVGEDISDGEQSDPLHDIGEQMLRAARWISHSQPAEQTLLLQQGILRDLDAVIDQARQGKKQGSRGTAQPMAVAPRDTVDQSPPPSATGIPGENSRPQHIGQRLDANHGPDVEVDMAEMEALIKEIWGRLPPRSREQLLNSHVERFLPLYDQIISEYFKRLAEEEAAEDVPR